MFSSTSITLTSNSPLRSHRRSLPLPQYPNPRQQTRSRTPLRRPANSISGMVQPYTARSENTIRTLSKNPLPHNPKRYPPHPHTGPHIRPLLCTDKNRRHRHPLCGRRLPQRNRFKNGKSRGQSRQPPPGKKHLRCHKKIRPRTPPDTPPYSRPRSRTKTKSPANPITIAPPHRLHKSPSPQQSSPTQKYHHQKEQYPHPSPPQATPFAHKHPGSAQASP
jgi:hypothetical protein